MISYITPISPYIILNIVLRLTILFFTGYYFGFLFLFFQFLAFYLRKISIFYINFEAVSILGLKGAKALAKLLDQNPKPLQSVAGTGAALVVINEYSLEKRRKFLLEKLRICEVKILATNSRLQCNPDLNLNKDLFTLSSEIKAIEHNHAEAVGIVQEQAQLVVRLVTGILP